MNNAKQTRIINVYLTKCSPGINRPTSDYTTQFESYDVSNRDFGNILSQKVR